MPRFFLIQQQNIFFLAARISFLATRMFFLLREKINAVANCFFFTQENIFLDQKAFL